ncbi:hypothetical protein QTP86_023264 [Hemibagrus guttatus]|nr:hypothetical protein QTP86_023264 [Hemibagrus guttatus]
MIGQGFPKASYLTDEVSGRDFPECPEGSNVKTCTCDMDPVAFNTYTEFFTHAHSICHYLQSEEWQHRAEDTIHRLTESSAGVAEQLAFTQKMAEDLVAAQSASIKSQETILRNGEELKTTLQHSTNGLRDVFIEMRRSVEQQQMAFGEIFNRVAFLQSFIMSESHTLSSVMYNALGFFASFLLTSSPCTSGARFCLFGLVALNVYLERLICSTVMDSDNPGYQQMEQIAFWVGFLRKTMVGIAIVILFYFAKQFRNVKKESLEILRELKETHSKFEETLKKAERISGSLSDWTKPRQSEKWGNEEKSSLVILHPSGPIEATLPSFSPLHRSRQHESFVPRTEAASSSEIVKRHQRRSSGSRVRNSAAVVYGIMVEDGHNQPRYSLRSRKSLCALEPKD